MADNTGKKAETSLKNTGKKAVKPSFASRAKAFWKGVKAEFRKIIWPTKDSLQKQTILVLVVSVALSAFIRVFDILCQYIVGFIR
jgi:preprotein translocase subunit SecE